MFSEEKWATFYESNEIMADIQKLARITSSFAGLNMILFSLEKSMPIFGGFNLNLFGFLSSFGFAGMILL